MAWISFRVSNAAKRSICRRIEPAPGLTKIEPDSRGSRPGHPRLARGAQDVDARLCAGHDEQHAIALGDGGGTGGASELEVARGGRRRGIVLDQRAGLHPLTEWIESFEQPADILATKGDMSAGAQALAAYGRMVSRARQLSRWKAPGAQVSAAYEGAARVTITEARKR